MRRRIGQLTSRLALVAMTLAALAGCVIEPRDHGKFVRGERSISEPAEVATAIRMHRAQSVCVDGFGATLDIAGAQRRAASWGLKAGSADALSGECAGRQLYVFGFVLDPERKDRIVHPSDACNHFPCAPTTADPVGQGPFTTPTELVWAADRALPIPRGEYVQSTPWEDCPTSVEYTNHFQYRSGAFVAGSCMINLELSPDLREIALAQCIANASLAPRFAQSLPRFPKRLCWMPD